MAPTSAIKSNQALEQSLCLCLCRRFLLEWMSFTHRYIPVELLEVVPQVCAHSVFPSLCSCGHVCIASCLCGPIASLCTHCLRSAAHEGMARCSFICVSAASALARPGVRGPLAAGDAAGKRVSCRLGAHQRDAAGPCACQLHFCAQAQGQRLCQQ